MIDWNDIEIPTTTQAELLGLNQSSLYYKLVDSFPEKLAIKNRIDEIYTKHPYFGSRRLTVTLNNSGYHINRKSVQRHMRKMGTVEINKVGLIPRKNICIYPFETLASTSLSQKQTSKL